MSTLSRLLWALALAVLLCGVGSWLLVAAFVPALDHPLRLETTPAPSVLVRDVTVFEGTSPEGVLRHQDVHLEDGWVSFIRSTGSAVPEGAEVVDGRGHTLLPGLVDAHVHVDGSPAPPWFVMRPDPEHHLRAWLASGVTTVQDLGGEPYATVALRERVATGELVGPRIRTTGPPITAKGGHPTVVIESLVPWPLGGLVSSLVPQPTNHEEARAAVDANLDLKVDAIKLIRDALPESVPVLDRDLLAVLVDRAHERRVPVFVHVGSPQDAWEAAMAGADVLAHMVYRGEVEGPLAAELKKRDVAVIPTLSSFQATRELAVGAFEPSELDRTLHAESLLASVSGEAGLQFAELPALGEFAETLDRNAEHWAANLQLFRDAGVPILVGTDSALPGVWPGSSMHAEMRALVDIGMRPTEVLHGATGLLGQHLDLPGDIGTLREGGMAEAVLVRGDPTEDIRAAADVVWVTRRGLRHTPRSGL